MASFYETLDMLIFPSKEESFGLVVLEALAHGVPVAVFSDVGGGIDLILEAGCGRGQYVYALQRLGYRVAGVDFSAELVARVKEAKAAVNVAVGDVRALDFEDRSLGAYISLGVVEHFWDGMGGILSEARRVLEDAGVLLLSVPHFSPLFRRRAAKRCWTQRNTGCCGVAK